MAPFTFSLDPFLKARRMYNQENGWDVQECCIHVDPSHLYLGFGDTKTSVNAYQKLLFLC